MCGSRAPKMWLAYWKLFISLEGSATKNATTAGQLIWSLLKGTFLQSLPIVQIFVFWVGGGLSTSSATDRRSGPTKNDLFKDTPWKFEAAFKTSLIFPSLLVLTTRWCGNYQSGSVRVFNSLDLIGTINPNSKSSWKRLPRGVFRSGSFRTAFLNI